ncbi:MAG TPA: leucyl/phenylalanyl-tRNA--protein transferase [Planctomycetota bacterium]|nr:leucyl/phenylalanyl-tRNA--protein transferase [Planctomycetota bacterium]
MKLPPDLLVRAYAAGVFPMPDERGVIGWYQPDPRAILPLEQFHASRSLQRKLRKNIFDVTFDKDFLGVMQGCAERPSTWITEDFYEGYCALHHLGLAHSVEVWQDGKLVGGTYGVQLGGAFFAESKFHRVTDASKVALAKLVEHLREKNFGLLEVQFLTEHLAQFGVIEVPHKEYMKLLKAALKRSCSF